MADPATAAIVAKIATAVATDKRTWKLVGSIIGGVLFIILLPILLIVSTIGGGAENNINVAQIVFNGWEIPEEVTSPTREHMENMHDAFVIFEEQYALYNENFQTENAIDETLVKCVFYILYYGQNFSTLDDAYYYDFVAAFDVPNKDIEASL